jgi:magnesium-protoporphyrin IX monomethyl ester (oxidative) cyclase
MVPPTAVTDAKSGSSGVAVKDPVKDTILTPRFYTTDFEAMADMDLRPNEAELEAICEEFRKDYNRHHFVRNDEFEGAVSCFTRN